MRFYPNQSSSWKKERDCLYLSPDLSLFAHQPSHFYHLPLLSNPICHHTHQVIALCATTSQSFCAVFFCCCSSFLLCTGWVLLSYPAQSGPSFIATFVHVLFGCFFCKRRICPACERKTQATCLRSWCTKEGPVVTLDMLLNGHWMRITCIKCFLGFTDRIHTEVLFQKKHFKYMITIKKGKPAHVDWAQLIVASRMRFCQIPEDKLSSSSPSSSAN